MYRGILRRYVRLGPDCSLGVGACTDFWQVASFYSRVSYLRFAFMGSCIVCGRFVSVDAGNAWKITPGVPYALGVDRMYWIHKDCISHARHDQSAAS